MQAPLCTRFCAQELTCAGTILQIGGATVRSCEYCLRGQDGSPGSKLTVNGLLHLQSLQLLLDAAVPVSMPLKGLAMRFCYGLQRAALQGCCHLAALRALHLDRCGALHQLEGVLEALLNQAPQLTELSIVSSSSSGAVPTTTWLAGMGGLKKLSLPGHRLAGLPDGPYLSGGIQLPGKTYLCQLHLRTLACFSSTAFHHVCAPVLCLQAWRRWI